LAVLLAALTVAGPASAESLPAFPAFHLRASNGYSVSVLAGTDRKTGKGDIAVFVGNRTSSVFYSTRAAVSATSIEADLGAVGRIDVDFVPSGVPKTERPDCGGKPITFEGGRWEGEIDFEGEHGYSEAHATSVRDEAKPALAILCALVGGPVGVGRSGGGHLPGALLETRNKAQRAEFRAMKNGPADPARLTASIVEKRGSMQIIRSVDVVAPPGAFQFDVAAGVATVDPPAPFSGRGEYRRRRGGGSTWRGDLAVDFPGRANVRLAGGSTHASLEGAVQHPAHQSGSA
jgi:hypothetical protein